MKLLRVIVLLSSCFGICASSAQESGHGAWAQWLNCAQSIEPALDERELLLLRGRHDGLEGIFLYSEQEARFYRFPDSFSNLPEEGDYVAFRFKTEIAGVGMRYIEAYPNIWGHTNLTVAKRPEKRCVQKTTCKDAANWVAKEYTEEAGALLPADDMMSREILAVEIASRVDAMSRYLSDPPSIMAWKVFGSTLTGDGSFEGYRNFFLNSLSACEKVDFPLVQNAISQEKSSLASMTDLAETKQH